MLSAIVVTLTLVGLLLIIVRLSLGVLRRYRYQQSIQATAPLALSHTSGCRVMTLLEVQDGSMIQHQQPPLTLPASWYSHLRTIISLSFLLMVLLALFVQGGLADGAIKNFSKSLSLLTYSQFNAADVHAVAHSTQTQVNASQQLMRISQLAPNQYSTPDEYHTWAYSACSTASMTEVFNAYGRHLHITDVLKVEAGIGAITPELGLLDPSGIAATATQFGFKTTWSNTWTLDQVIAIANSGRPVIVGFPPDRYDGGHLLVMTGGSDTMVYLADSSLWNRQAITRSQFLQWWAGFGAVVTPK